MNGRKLIAVLLAVGVVIGLGIIVFAPGDDGDAGAPTTTTPETTTTPPATTPAPTTTATPTPTATPTSTTTVTPAPNFETVAEVSETEVHDGEATVSITVTNAGTGGEYVGTITVDRHDGEHYDMEATAGGYVGPNGEETFTYLIDFGATGTYTVALDGAPVAEVSVYSLGTYSGGGGSTGSIDPIVNGTVDGEASAG